MHHPPLMPDWLTDGWPHIWLPYTQMATAPLPLPIVGAQGCRLQLADGRELIDGIASWWSMCHGYQHPALVAAIQAQAETLAHAMFAGLAHAPAYRLAGKLCAAVGGGMERVFFAESGSVAVEVALKMALQYWRNKGHPKRNKFVFFEGAYHGDTVGAMSVSSDSDFKRAYDNLTLRNYQLPLPHDEYSFAEFTETLSAIRGQVAAIIMEPLVQAAGGFRMHSADILSEIRRVAREHDVLLILDEIATGFGRTGNMFAFHEAAIAPDIVCVGKALTGGHMPLAATLASAEIFEAFLGESRDLALMHGPTFMAHPIACATAEASLDLFATEGRLAQAEALELALWEGLKPFRHHEKVLEIRVKGAIGVLELREGVDVYALRHALVEQGVWLRPFGTVLYLMPPLTISEAELEQLFAAIAAVL